jgi:lysozyme
MSDMSLNNPALDNRVTTVNPKGRSGWVMATVVCLTLWEGFAPTGHHDPIDPKGVNTVCFGHIEDVRIGDHYTKIQCQAMLAQDLPRYEKMVENAIHVPMPGYRHAAIVSFTYNVGGGALKKSSVARYINAGEPNKGCDALLLYDRANKRVVPGLENRRKAERKMCLNNNEPPLPDNEVMKEKHIDVDQAIAIKEAKQIDVTAPAVVQPAAPVPAPKSDGFVGWLMEK